MDLTLITAAVNAINVSKDLAKAAIGVRDFNEMAPVVAGLNDQLLKAQQALFAHNAQLLALQHEQFETAKELAKAKEALAEKGRYSLVELSRGIFVYRVNVAPVGSHVGDPVRAEPLHYVCQPCFDKGIKVVLQRVESAGGVGHRCSGCKNVFTEIEIPYAPQEQHNSWLD